MEYAVYTDGSCKGNGKNENVGGWGFCIPRYGYCESWGRKKNTTNNEMELTAVLMALRYCDTYLEDDDSVIIYSDSAYFINCYQQGWYRKWVNNGWKNAKKESVKNRELWEQILPFFSDKRFKFKKVKGHAGEEFNEVADRLAQLGADETRKMEDNTCFLSLFPIN